MICPECKEQELKSNVFPHGGTKTLMYCQPYYDENGIYHHHDRNVVTNSFSCTNNHQWTTRRYDYCPAGDFGGPIDG